MQWRIALHKHGDIALNGCECMVIINTVFGNWLSGLGIVGQCPTELHGCIYENENMCRVIASRYRYPLG